MRFTGLCFVFYIVVSKHFTTVETSAFQIRPENYVLADVSPPVTPYSGLTVINCARNCMANQDCAAFVYNVDTCWFHITQSGNTVSVAASDSVFERLDRTFPLAGSLQSGTKLSSSDLTYGQMAFG